MLPAEVFYGGSVVSLTCAVYQWATLEKAKINGEEVLEDSSQGGRDLVLNLRNYRIFVNSTLS